MLDQTKLDDISGFANMTGNHLPPVTHLKWIVDTGASHHMVGDPICLHHSVLIEKAGQDLAFGKVRVIGEEEDVLYTLYSQYGHKVTYPQLCLTTLQGVETQQLNSPYLFAYDVIAAESTYSVNCQDSAGSPPSQNCEVDSTSAAHVDSHPYDTSSPPVRRSNRSYKPPIWHKDYVTKAGSNMCHYSLASILDYAGLSPTFQSFEIKQICNTLACDGIQISMDELFLYALHGFPAEYDTIIAILHARETLVTFEELHEKLLDFEQNHIRSSSSTTVPITINFVAKPLLHNNRSRPNHASRPRNNSNSTNRPASNNFGDQLAGQNINRNCPRVTCQLCDSLVIT
ncbi:hypothetical protein H5410_045554 [Solanum commersonii]|uniref:Uncharacterized protein n=1 Tax=Solanum commersonii TaxID=4109 RepID=A0A9J5XE02_SOLCO|nr:hypothetical protein H5410_045554 [Solanum commersonii]